MSKEIYHVRLINDNDPALQNDSVPRGYFVVADTERKAWTTAQKAALTPEERSAYLKSAKRAECREIGEAWDHVATGVLVAEYE